MYDLSTLQLINALPSVAGETPAHATDPEKVRRLDRAINNTHPGRLYLLGLNTVGNRRHCDSRKRCAMTSRYWTPSKDGDLVGYSLYRRHYAAKKNPRPKIRQFVGPGQKFVLIGTEGNAVWAWRKFIDDCIDQRTGQKQQGVNCSVFRNESRNLSSDMILEAMQFGWEKWPGERLYTYVDPSEVKGTNPGYCFQRAGWKKCGKTKKGLIVYEALPGKIVGHNGQPVRVAA